MIRAVLPVARGYGDEQREQEIRALLTRLAAGRFQLAVIGQFSRGKTTLMNALLGHAYLPMGALPMTSVVTTVRYGARARALVRSRAAALPVEVPVTEVARFVARSGTERARMQVASVDVEIPAELLRLGFEFVDTPGVGSAVAANTAATLRYLPQADAIVFVTAFDSALTAAEADFLAGAAGHAGKLFLVVNKRDLVSAAEAAEVAGYVRQWARGSLPAGLQVFEVSALQALDAAISGDAALLAASGIGPLRDALTQFLTAEQGRLALRNVATGAARLVARQQRDLRLAQPADGAAAGSGGAARFEARVTELLDQVGALADQIASSSAVAAQAVLADCRAAWLAELSQRVAPLATAALTAVRTPAGDQAPDVPDALQLAERQAAADWLEIRAAEFGEAVIAAAAQGIAALMDLARSPRQLGAALAGLPAPASPQAGWTAEELPEFAVRAVDWTSPVRPARSRRGRGTDRANAEAAAAAVADFLDRAGAALLASATDWALRLGDQAKRLVRAEAAQVGRYLTTRPHADDLTVLADLGSRLAAYQQALVSWLPGAEGQAAGPDAQPPAGAAAGPQASCAICSRLELAQTEYLIHRQYQLATRQSDQARHAETGGFCPLHSWQYAHLASPVGISAGTATLAGQLAGALQDAGAGSRDAGELAGRVAALVGTVSCPACAVLAEAERQAAQQLAAQGPVPDGPPQLCLRHLALVLDLHPELADGRAMTSALAATLARASQDMRAYALKREALRRSLITADEASAYTDALRLLAGQAALAMPAQPD